MCIGSRLDNPRFVDWIYALDDEVDDLRRMGMAPSPGAKINRAAWIGCNACLEFGQSVAEPLAVSVRQAWHDKCKPGGA